MFLENWWERLTRGIIKYDDTSASPDRYIALRRNIVILMMVVTIVPLTFMAVIPMMVIPIILLFPTIKSVR